MMDRRWRVLVLLIAASAVVVAAVPTLRYTTRWQLMAIRRREMLKRFPLLREGWKYRSALDTLVATAGFTCPSDEDLTRALRQHPRDWRLAAGVALLAPLRRPWRDYSSETADQNVRRCRDAFEKAIAIRPDLARLRGWAAAAYLVNSADWSVDRAASGPRYDWRLDRPGLLALAGEHLRAATRLDPKNGFYNQLLAYYWLLKSQPDKAITELEKALAKPNWATYLPATRSPVEHAFLTAGADPLAAALALLSVFVGMERSGTLSCLDWHFGSMAWKAKQAGDHEQAIRIYRLLIGLASKIRQRGGAEEGQLWAITMGRIVETASLDMLGRRPESDPGLAALPGPSRRATATRLMEQEWSDYLRDNGYGNLAMFAVAEREAGDTFKSRYRYEQVRIERGGALTRAAHLWALQAWVAAALMVVLAAMAALWLARLLPAQLRSRATLAFEDQGPLAPVVRVALIALAFSALYLLVACVVGEYLWSAALLLISAAVLTVVVILAHAARAAAADAAGESRLSGGGDSFDAGPGNRRPNTALWHTIAVILAAMFVAAAMVFFWVPWYGPVRSLLILALLAALMAAALFALRVVAGRIYAQRPMAGGFVTQLVRILRSGSLWLATALLSLWLALGAPLYITARIGIGELTTMRQAMDDVTRVVPGVTSPMPPVPGPDSPTAE